MIFGGGGAGLWDERLGCRVYGLGVYAVISLLFVTNCKSLVFFKGRPPHRPAYPISGSVSFQVADVKYVIFFFSAVHLNH